MISETTRRQRRHERSADGTIGYRADIDGLRALAILLVVVYHVWFGRVSGGVDVFLMISAFFLTASFARRASRGVPLSLGRFWLRKFRRLLPAAAVTIVGVIAAAILVYPEVEWPRLWREAWSSLFYVENWTLAASNVDYYARDATTPSPFQHFWSLSVQGQVFILWPLLITFAVLITRRHRERVVPALALLFFAIFAASLAFSIYETATSQSFAYFDTRTRLWEFAAGSLVALALPYLKLPAVLGNLIGWAGVIGIVTCGLVLDVQGGFPGYFALWPVLCTAAVIVAGQKELRGSPSRFLASRPLRLLGRDAYALYLVHWPVLITWKVMTGRSEPGPLAGLAIIVLSFLIARAIAWGVEGPLRHAALFDRHALWGATVVVTAAAVVAVPLAVWQTGELRRAAELAAADARDYPGAAGLESSDLLTAGLPLRPSGLTLDKEWVDLGVECGELEPTDELLDGSCMSNAAAHDPGSPLVLVMGDSHAQQLTSPLRVVADESGWGIVALLKGGCSIGIDAPSKSVSGPPCEEWRRSALTYALNLKPDALYLVVTRAEPDGSETFIEGIQQIIDEFTAQGVPVVAVRDNPRFDTDMYSCASAGNRGCDMPHLDSGVDLARVSRAGSVIPVDFTPWLCPEKVCRAEIGNVAVYMDDNHLTDSYGRTMAPMLWTMLEKGRLPLVRTSGP